MTTSPEHNRQKGAYTWSDREYPTVYHPGPSHLLVWESDTVWAYDGTWRCVSHPERPDKYPDDALRYASTRDKTTVRERMQYVERQWERTR